MPFNKGLELERSQKLFLSGISGFEKTKAFIDTHKDKFILGGWISLFERMQYLRGTENLFMDTLIESPEYFKLMEIVEDFYNTYLDEAQIRSRRNNFRRRLGLTTLFTNLA